MKITQNEISFALPTDGLSDYLKEQHTKMKRFRTFSPFVGERYILKMIDNIEKFDILSPHQLSAVENILKIKHFVDTIEKKIDEGVYGLFSSGFLNFGYHSTLYNRIIGKGIHGFNNYNGRKEKDLLKFRVEMFGPEGIDPLLKNYFYEYAQKYKKSHSAQNMISYEWVYSLCS